MNIIFDCKEFNIENVFFLETKKNILMDGNFTKIIYSDDLVSINGIYLSFPIQQYNVSKVINKKFINFQLQNTNNIYIIKELSSIETKILMYYKKLFCCDKIPCNVLYDQLNTGNLKIYRESGLEFNSLHQKIIIKISGIWEDKHHFGITYKFVEVNYT